MTRVPLQPVLTAIATSFGFFEEQNNMHLFEIISVIKQDQSMTESFELEEVAQFYCAMPRLY